MIRSTLNGEFMQHMRKRDDRGAAQFIGALVGMIITVIAAGLALNAIMNANAATIDHIDRGDLWADMQDASGGLLHDVIAGTEIVTASDDRFVIRKIVDGKCQTRDWQVDGGQLTVDTTFHDGDCPDLTADTSSDGAREHVVIAAGMVDAPSDPAYEPTFRYYSSSTDPMPTPVGSLYTEDVNEQREQAEALSRIGRVEWTLVAQSADDIKPLRLMSGAAYTGQGVSRKAGTGTPKYDPVAPNLQVVTAVVGRDDPRLRWGAVNSDVAVGWNVFRNHWEEGRQDATATGWEQVDYLPAATRTWTDTALPDGHTAQYAVQGVLDPNSTGGQATSPTSNVVVTGMRPVAPASHTVTGQAQGLRLQWAKPVGATSYDVYRSHNTTGAMTPYKTSVPTAGTSTLTWTDATGYGHSHNYQVVAVNRWERTAADKGATRLFSGKDGDFTAPAAPTFTAVEQANWSNRLTWTPAPWTGSGPTTVDGDHRDGSWYAQKASTTGATRSGSWIDLWNGAGTAHGTKIKDDTYTQAQVAGQYRHYQARTENASGTSPWSAYDQSKHRALQRPPVPTCTTGDGGVTSHQMLLAVGRPAMPSNYVSSNVVGGTPAAGYSVDGIGVNAAVVRNINRLQHNTEHTFSVANQNDSRANGGWSDPVSCKHTTAKLTVAFKSLASTTRSVTAEITHGPAHTSPSVSLSGHGTIGGSRVTFDPLRHNSSFTATAHNTDGYNKVSALGQSVHTKELLPPATPTCSATRDSQYAPTTVRFTTNGDSITRSSQYVTSAGTYTATASNSNTDGYNTVTRSTPCSIYVDAPPWYNDGSPGGTPSPLCAPYSSHGTVVDLLAEARSRATARNNHSIGLPVSGSSVADYGSYYSGGGSMPLQCIFYRKHHLIRDFDGDIAGTHTIQAVWLQSGLPGGGGAV